MFVPRANAGRADGMTQLNLRIKPVNRAGLGIKLGECVAQVFSKSTELIIFCRARDERKFAAYAHVEPSRCAAGLTEVCGALADHRSGWL